MGSSDGSWDLRASSSSGSPSPRRRSSSRSPSVRRSKSRSPLLPSGSTRSPSCSSCRRPQSRSHRASRPTRPVRGRSWSPLVRTRRPTPVHAFRSIRDIPLLERIAMLRAGSPAPVDRGGPYQFRRSPRLQDQTLASRRRGSTRRKYRRSPSKR